VLAEEPFCRWCIERDQVTIESRSTICDHIIPLTEDGTDDRSNLAGMCATCHDEKTAAEAARALGRAAPAAPIAARGIATSGRPTSPDHPWNRTPPQRLQRP
jgi:5-methylcytosine-specific restriction protein A